MFKYSKLQTVDSKLQTAVGLGMHMFTDKNEWKSANADIFVHTTGVPQVQHFFGKSLIRFENQFPNIGAISRENRTTPMIYRNLQVEKWHYYIMTEAMLKELALKYSVAFLEPSK